MGLWAMSDTMFECECGDITPYNIIKRTKRIIIYDGKFICENCFWAPWMEGFDDKLLDVFELE